MILIKSNNIYQSVNVQHYNTFLAAKYSLFILMCLIETYQPTKVQFQIVQIQKRTK